ACRIAGTRQNACGGFAGAADRRRGRGLCARACLVWRTGRWACRADCRRATGGAGLMAIRPGESGTTRAVVESGLPLAGKCIAVPESRELDVFAALLERRGASVLRCPLVEIRDAPDPAPVLDWLRQFNAGGCDDLLLYTGEGLHRRLAALDRPAPTERAGFVARLAQVRIVARGPKPARVLRELGLRPERIAEPATTPGMIACLREFELHGRRVGVQLYGSESNAPLMDFLAEAGALALPVAPYRYADAADDADVLA